MALILQGVEGTVEGKTVEIGPEPITFGRHKKNRVVLKDPGISNYHAVLTRDAQGLTITDLQSTNGTRVNGKKVERRTLEEGDMLAFMGAVFAVVDPEARARPAAEAAAEAAAKPPAPGPKAAPAARRPSPAPAAARPSPPRPSPAASAPVADETDDEDVLEFDYDTLLEETSRASVGQTIGLVVVSGLILVFGIVLVRGFLAEPPPPPSLATNLLDNGSLEMEGGWTFVDGSAGEIDAGPAADGQRSLRLDLGTGADGVTVCRSDRAIAVGGGRAVQARAEVLCESDALAGIRLRWLSDRDPTFAAVSIVPPVVGPSDWEELRGNFTPPEKATKVEFECFAYGAEGVVRFDRLKLTETDSKSGLLRSASPTGVRLKMDEKGVADIHRGGVQFVRGLELLVGDAPFDRLSAASARLAKEGEANVYTGKIHEAASGSKREFELGVAEGPDGPVLRYGVEGDGELVLSFETRTRGVGGSGPTVGDRDGVPVDLPWRFEDTPATELILGRGDRLISLGFSEPVTVASSESEGVARFRVIARPTRKEGGLARLDVTVRAVSPLLADRASSLLARGRELTENGPWGKATEVFGEIEQVLEGVPGVKEQLEGLKKRIEDETARRLDEIDRVVDEARDLSSPALIEVATRLTDDLDALWQGGAAAPRIAERREAVAGLEVKRATDETEGEAARLYAEARAHKEAGRFHLAGMMYRYILEAFPASGVIAKTRIDLEQVEKAANP